MKIISMQVNFAGVMLPVTTNEQGQQMVPLKPITDIVGIQWERQRTKVRDNEPFKSELGACVKTCIAGNQKRKQVCIRLDRVAFFLMAINPRQVRAQGNVSASEFLAQKLTEWSDALHDFYVELGKLGVAAGLNHVAFVKRLQAIRKARASAVQQSPCPG